MKLYIYADESGTFDKEHNDLFVYGGLVVPGDSAKRNLERKYSAIENDIRRNASRFGEDDELKACYLRMKERKRLFALLQKSQCVQFGVVVDRAADARNLQPQEGQQAHRRTRCDRLGNSDFARLVERVTGHKVLRFVVWQGVDSCVFAGGWGHPLPTDVA